MGYIKKLKRMRNTIAKRTGYKLNEIEKNKLLIDYLWEHYVHGVVLIEYNQYEFSYKNIEDEIEKLELEINSQNFQDKDTIKRWQLYKNRLDKSIGDGE